MSNKKVFVTGGAGYIGSHTCLELLKQKYKVMVFDNLSNGSITALERVQSITNKTLEFVAGDIREQSMLSDTMSKFQPDTVIHLAGLKQVNESLSKVLNQTVHVHIFKSFFCILCFRFHYGCFRRTKFFFRI